jgi:hypothetical protein
MMMELAAQVNNYFVKVIIVNRIKETYNEKLLDERNA